MEKRNFEEEFTFRTARSGGAGGQNVNKVETKVEALWRPSDSQLLTDVERSFILLKLADKLDNEGFIHSSSQETRSQLANKLLTIEKLNLIINRALFREPPRKITRKPRAIKEKILKNKAIRSEVKTFRQKPNLFSED